MTKYKLGDIVKADSINILHSDARANLLAAGFTLPNIDDGEKVPLTEKAQELNGIFADSTTKGSCYVCKHNAPIVRVAQHCQYDFLKGHYQPTRMTVVISDKLKNMQEQGKLTQPELKAIVGDEVNTRILF